MSEKNYITPDGLKRLVDEHDYLSTKERPETVKVVKWAASLGDRSENADYQYGKKRLREIDKRLRFLKKRIELAEEVDPSTIDSPRAQFGARITVEDEQGERKTFTIVGVDETEPKEGRISWRSPIGSSLLGKEIGDDVLVKTPSGEFEYQILDISYQKITISKWQPTTLGRREDET